MAQKGGRVSALWALLFFLFLLLTPLPSEGQNTTDTNSTTTDNPKNESSSVTVTPKHTGSVPTATMSSSPSSSTHNVTWMSPAPGCGRGLDPAYAFLCDRRAAWGIVVEALASLGFLVSAVLLLGLVAWAIWACLPRRRHSRGVGGGISALLLFLLGVAGLFGLTFATVIRLTAQTCPTRVFLFGVLFALCFAALLARALALQGFAAARGWGEPVLVLALAAVQVIIATQWLLTVLVRDGLPCAYSQGEFVMLLIYVLCLLVAALTLTLRGLCRSCCTYSYGPAHSRARAQAALLFLTTLLSACIWVVWIALLTRGNLAMGRQPGWDDPVLSVALLANGWALLLGHVLPQACFLCRAEGLGKDGPLDFAGWTSPTGGLPGLGDSTKEGHDNGSFQNDGPGHRGKGQEPMLRSPYESGFSMTEIDPDKDYSIPRPQTTNTTEPYDAYYGNRLSD